MPGRLTTHVLDTARGCPAEGLTLRLLRLGPQAEALLGTFRTNADGRCDTPLLAGNDLVTGRYRLEFAAGDYLRRSGAGLSEPPFLDTIPIEFGIADPQAHYHVPLLLSPYGYSTYRGS